MTSRRPPSSDGLRFELLDLELVGLGVAAVHAVEIGGKERGFVAAGAGADFDDGVAVFVLVRREQEDLDLLLRDSAMRFFELRGFPPRPSRQARGRAPCASSWLSLSSICALR